MKKNRPILGMMLSFVMLIALGWVFHHNMPSSVEAQTCVRVPQYDWVVSSRAWSFGKQKKRAPISNVDVNRSACFLSFVQLENLDDDDDEWGACYLEKGETWYVVAETSLDDAEAGCGATCLTW